LDRGGFRRAISFFASAGRAVIAIYAGPRFHTLILFPAAFGLLVLSRMSGITKNGLVVAYAPSREGLVQANARLGRLGVIGGLMVLPLGLGFLKLGGAQSVLYLAAVVFVLAALLNLRLPQPRPDPPGDGAQVDRRGRVAAPAAPAGGTAGLRGADGFPGVLLAFALRRGRAQGRVFVRYEVAFQLAWVGGAFIPAIAPVTFRPGVLVLALFYLAMSLWYLIRPRLQRSSRAPGEESR